MSDTFEHNPGDHEDPLPGPMWIIGLLGTVLLIVIVLGLTALLYSAQQQKVIETVVLRDPDELINLRERQLAQLEGQPRWVERSKLLPGQDNPQIVTNLVIPIDQAMELIVREAQQQSSNSH